MLSVPQGDTLKTGKYLQNAFRSHHLLFLSYYVLSTSREISMAHSVLLDGPQNPRYSHLCVEFTD